MANIILILGNDSFILGSNNTINSAFNTTINGNDNNILNGTIFNTINGAYNIINSSNNIIIGSYNSASSLGFYLGYNNNSNSSYYNFQFGNNNFIPNNSEYNFQFGLGLDNHKLGIPSANSYYNIGIGHYNALLDPTYSEMFTIGNGTSGNRNTLFKIVDNNIDPYLQFMIVNQGNMHKLFYSDLPLSSNYLKINASSAFVTKTIDEISDYVSARNSIDNGSSVRIISDFIRIPTDVTNSGGSYAANYKRNGITHSIKGNIPLYIPNSNTSLDFGDLLFRFAPSAESIDTFYIYAYKNGNYIDDTNIVNTVLSTPSYRFDNTNKIVSLLVNAGAVYWADSSVGPCPYEDETSATQYHYLPSRLILDTSWIDTIS